MSLRKRLAASSLALALLGGTMVATAPAASAAQHYWTTGRYTTMVKCQAVYVTKVAALTIKKATITKHDPCIWTSMGYEGRLSYKD